MTVQAGPTEVQYEGNGVTTIYIFQFQMLDASHIRTTVDGVVLDPSEFTVTLNDNNIGGQVEYNVAPADGVEIFISRQTPDDQLVSYPPYTPLPAEVVEFSLDKLTMQTQELETASGLTEEEIDILRALFEALDIRVTQNTDDIDDLEGRVTVNENAIVVLDGQVTAIEGELPNFINKDGSVAMDGQLKVLIAPEDDLDAVSNIFMRNFITALIEGLVLLGFYDASGNTNPPDAGETGEFFIIAAAGTLNVSDGISAPTPTAVNVGDYIIWSDATQTPPLDEVWVHIPRLIASAAGVSFDPTGTDYTATNVQDALVETEDLFVSAISDQGGLAGGKDWLGQHTWANSASIGLLGTGGGGGGGLNSSGTFRMVTLGTDITQIQKRNSIGTAWIDVVRINVNGIFIFDDTPPQSQNAAAGPNDLVRLTEVEDLVDGFVDTTTNQENIAGDKGWIGDQSVDNTTAYHLRGTGAGGGAGNDASGTFRTLTDGSDITGFQKRNSLGTAWVEVFDVAPNGLFNIRGITILHNNFRLSNVAAAFEFLPQAGGLGLGAQRMAMSATDIWSHQWHDGDGFEDRHRIFADGSQQFDGFCTFNNALAVAAITVSGISIFTGIADFIAVPTCSTNATTSNELTNKDTVDKHASVNHRTTEALALQASIDNPDEIFYADAGS